MKSTNGTQDVRPHKHALTFVPEFKVDRPPFDATKPVTGAETRTRGKYRLDRGPDHEMIPEINVIPSLDNELHDKKKIFSQPTSTKKPFKDLDMKKYTHRLNRHKCTLLNKRCHA